MSTLTRPDSSRDPSQARPARVSAGAPLLLRLSLFLSLVLTLRLVEAHVVINEIFSHAPDDIEDLEWVELHNPDPMVADLGGWAFTQGISFQFPAGTLLEPGGYLVVCRNQARFREYYDVPVAGVFSQHLSHKGERLELSAPGGRVIDAVKYHDKAPWPMGPVGYSGSLERISPGARSNDPLNWISSPLSKDHLKPSGTPGRRNAGFSAKLPPTLTHVRLSSEHPAPGEPIQVEATVRDGDGVAEVRVLYRLAGPGWERPEATIAMQSLPESRYRASIPGQAAEQLVRCRILALSSNGTRRFFPAETEPRPALSAYVHGPITPGAIPFGWILHTVDSEHDAAMEHVRRFDAGRDAPRVEPEKSGIALALGRRVLSDGDTNKDRRLTREEFAGLAAIWFEKLDPDKTGGVSRQEFISGLDEILPVAPATDAGGAGARPGGGTRGGGQHERGAGTVGPEFGATLFGALNGNNDGALTREELRTALVRWFGEWDRAGNGTLNLAQLAEGWRATILAKAGGASDRATAHEKFKAPSRGSISSRSALIYFDPPSSRLQVFDFVEVTPRSGGFKIHFHKDAELDRMTAINLVYDNERAALAEPLAYELYRRAGVPAAQSHHVRLWVDGVPVGYHLLVEQPNRGFLRRNRLPDDGNLYKLAALETDVVGQHEKKTHPRLGHEDIVALIESLRKLQGNGSAQWDFIRTNFDVDEVVNYFAVCMALSNWDGFANNYLTYHDVTGTGRWTVYPWDQDQTWGIVNRGQAGQVLVELPLTFGMEGDAPPKVSREAGGPPPWWRPGGWFSRPLLANPTFRKLFLTRTKEILEKHYTIENFGPLIDRLAAQLRPEVKLRADLTKSDAALAERSFERNLQALRDHLSQRRAFLLAQEEMQQAGKTP